MLVVLSIVFGLIWFMITFFKAQFLETNFQEHSVYKKKPKYSVVFVLGIKDNQEKFIEDLKELSSDYCCCVFKVNDENINDTAYTNKTVELIEKRFQHKAQSKCKKFLIVNTKPRFKDYLAEKLSKANLGYYRELYQVDNVEAVQFWCEETHTKI